MTNRNNFDHKFLHCKEFHPASKQNQKILWEAQQKAIHDKKVAADRALQLKRFEDYLILFCVCQEYSFENNFKMNDYV